jgi:hypothetical protein
MTLNFLCRRQPAVRWIFGDLGKIYGNRPGGDGPMITAAAIIAKKSRARDVVLQIPSPARGFRCW